MDRRNTIRRQIPRGLYPITDAATGDPVAQALSLIQLGCGVVQLRAKAWPTDRLAEAGRALLPDFEARGCLLLVNDDVEAAAQAGAHGVHLGQEDGELSRARRALGPLGIVGRSTHTLEQVHDAVAEGADYIGFGPVFTTGTKETGWSARGLEALALVVRRCPVPVVAIGGIDLARLAAVQATGAHAWAAISAIWGAGGRLAERVASLGPAAG